MPFASPNSNVWIYQFHCWYDLKKFKALWPLTTCAIQICVQQFVNQDVKSLTILHSAFCCRWNYIFQPEMYRLDVQRSFIQLQLSTQEKNLTSPPHPLTPPATTITKTNSFLPDSNYSSSERKPQVLRQQPIYSHAPKKGENNCAGSQY